MLTLAVFQFIPFLFATLLAAGASLAVAQLTRPKDIPLLPKPPKEDAQKKLREQEAKRRRSREAFIASQSNLGPALLSSQAPGLKFRRLGKT